MRLAPHPKIVFFFSLFKRSYPFPPSVSHSIEQDKSQIYRRHGAAHGIFLRRQECRCETEVGVAVSPSIMTIAEMMYWLVLHSCSIVLLLGSIYRWSRDVGHAFLQFFSRDETTNTNIRLAP